MDTSSGTAVIFSLAHHVELNRAGWWDKAIQRFLLSIFWLEDCSIDGETLANSVLLQFHVHVSPAQIRSQVGALCGSGDLVAERAGFYRLSESARAALEKAIHEAEILQNEARERFDEVLAMHGSTQPSGSIWDDFNERFLLPLVRELGASVYHLIGGDRLTFDQTRLKSFLASYPLDSQETLREALLQFLDPRDTRVRSYILRSLTTAFLLEAGNLPDSTLQQISDLANRRPVFNVFLDTNFLLSYLGLHENPANEVATSLTAIATQVSKLVRLNLYVLPITIDETKRVLIAHKMYLKDLRLTPNLVTALVGQSLSGISEKYIDVCRSRGDQIAVDDYFGPYLDDLVTVLRSRGAELFNEDMGKYRTQQGVVDDILQQKEHFKKSAKPKSYEQLEHDMVLWHVVAEKRPPTVESPLDAQYWIVTVDYRLLGFDSYKSRLASGPVPLCLHPSTLIQMLQFWVPRTPEFEQAIVGSMRLPFLFQDFDKEAERVTLRILRALGRYEDVGDLPADTVTAILLNDALRQKMTSETDVNREAALIRDALIEEQRKTATRLTAATERVTGLQGEVLAGTHQIEKLSAEVATAQLELADRDQAISQLTTRLQSLEQRDETRQKEVLAERTRRVFLLRWVPGFFLVLVALSLLGAIVGQGVGRPGPWRGCALGSSIGALAGLWLVCWSGRKNLDLAEWAAFEKLLRFHKWIFGILWVLLLGVLANIIFALAWK